MNPAQRLVAHRGDQTEAVENSLQAFESAAKGGALYLECDVQFTVDRIPVVIHDNDLHRLCRVSRQVAQLTIDELKSITAPFFTLLSLQELMHWLQKYPKLTIFVEIKDEARSWLSDDEISLLIHRDIPAPLWSQVVVISYSNEIIAACSKQMNCDFGWVSDELVDVPQDIISVVAYYFTDAMHAELLSGLKESEKYFGTKFAVYTVNSPEKAFELISQGINLVETNYFSTVTRYIKEL